MRYENPTDYDWYINIELGCHYINRYIYIIMPVSSITVNNSKTMATHQWNNVISINWNGFAIQVNSIWHEIWLALMIAKSLSKMSFVSMAQLRWYRFSLLASLMGTLPAIECAIWGAIICQRLKWIPVWIDCGQTWVDSLGDFRGSWHGVRSGKRHCKGH